MSCNGQANARADQLYSDNLRLRQQQATQQTESEALTSQAHAMLSMNLKLQSNVTRQSNKHVENDMRDLLAVEVSLELEMIRVCIRLSRKLQLIYRLSALLASVHSSKRPARNQGRSLFPSTRR